MSSIIIVVILVIIIISNGSKPNVGWNSIVIHGILKYSNHNSIIHMLIIAEICFIHCSDWRGWPLFRSYLEAYNYENSDLLIVCSPVHLTICRYHKFDVPRLPHMRTFLSEDEVHIMEQPVQIRKGYSYKKMLGQVLTSNRWSLDAQLRMIGSCV